MVWIFAGEAPVPPLPVRLVGPPSLTTAVAFGPGGNLLATGYRNGMVHIWKPREHDQTVGVQPLDGQIETLAWGPPAARRAAAARRRDRGRLAGGVGDRPARRAAGPPARPTQVRRDPSGNLPTLYLHKLR